MSTRNELFFVEWISELQEEIGNLQSQISNPIYGPETKLLMVKGYDSANATPEDERTLYTQVSIFDDLPDNLLDKTWRDPQIWEKNY